MAKDLVAAVAKATARYEQARDEVVAAIVEALTAGEPPTDVADASPWSAAHVRNLARDHGVPAARKRRR